MRELYLPLIEQYLVFVLLSAALSNRYQLKYILVNLLILRFNPLTVKFFGAVPKIL